MTLVILTCAFAVAILVGSAALLPLGLLSQSAADTQQHAVLSSLAAATATNRTVAATQTAATKTFHYKTVSDSAAANPSIAANTYSQQQPDSPKLLAKSTRTSSSQQPETRKSPLAAARTTPPHCNTTLLNSNSSAFAHWDVPAFGHPEWQRLLFDLPGCRPLSHAQTVACLHNRHVVLLGDSVSRYQFKNLVEFVHRGTSGWGRGFAESARTHAAALRAGVRPASGWRSSLHFNSVDLGHAEICDCGANKRHEKHVEHRYYFNAAHNIRLTFVWRPGGGRQAMQWHALNKIGVDCQNSAFAAAANGSALPRAVQKKTCPQRGCARFECNQPLDFVYPDENEGALAIIAQLGRVDAVIVNQGAWLPHVEVTTDPVLSAALLDLGRRLRAQAAARGNPRLDLYWKTTTQRGHGNVETFPSLGLPALIADGWRIIDARGLTYVFRELSVSNPPPLYYADGRTTHFAPFIYRGLNELTLLELCRGER